MLNSENKLIIFISIPPNYSKRKINLLQYKNKYELIKYCKYIYLEDIF